MLIVGLGAGLGALTGKGQNLLVTVLSTLTSAAPFLPLRRWLQACVDRRVYPRRYDAGLIPVQTAAARAEIDLDPLAGRLEEVVDAIMQPAHTRLWLLINAKTAPGHDPLGKQGAGETRSQRDA